MFGGKVGKENQHVKCRRRCRATLPEVLTRLQPLTHKVADPMIETSKRCTDGSLERMLLRSKRSRGKLIENQWVDFLGFARIFY
jgi:NifB/MoaA-like Fe-S oxidoreductase